MDRVLDFSLLGKKKKKKKMLPIKRPIAFGARLWQTVADDL